MLFVIKQLFHVDDANGHVRPLERGDVIIVLARVVRNKDRNDDRAIFCKHGMSVVYNWGYYRNEGFIGTFYE